MAALRELSETERAAYFRGMQPLWGSGLDEERFVSFQERLAASAEARGRYRIVGAAGDAPGAACKLYDLRGFCDGRPLRLVGIGALFTPPAARRSGAASALLRAVLEEHRLEGFQAAVLFSDIGTAFYERLGFFPIESSECTLQADDLPRLSSRARSTAPGDEDLVSRFLAEQRAGEQRLSLSRDGWTLRLQLRRLRELARARGAPPPEWGLWIGAAAGTAVAITRPGRESLDVLDAAWTSERARDALLSALRETLDRTGRAQLKLWPAHQLRGFFPAQERTGAIAMLARLDPGAPLPGRDEATELALLDHI